MVREWRIIMLQLTVMTVMVLVMKNNYWDNNDHCRIKKGMVMEGYLTNASVRL